MSAARALRAAGIQGHVVQGAAAVGPEGGAVQQQREGDARAQMQGPGEPGSGLLPAPEAAQRRAGRLGPAHGAHVERQGELLQRVGHLGGKVTRHGEPDPGHGPELIARSDDRQAFAQHLGDLGGVRGIGEREHCSGAQRAGGVDGDQGEAVLVERAAQRSPGGVVDPQQGGPLAAGGAGVAALPEQPGRQQPLHGIGDGGGGDAQLASDLDARGLGAAAHEFEHRGVHRGGSSGARSAHAIPLACPGS